MTPGRPRYGTPPGAECARKTTEGTGLATQQNVRDRVLEIVCEQMGASRDKITDATSFVNDLGADSLDTVELVMEFEDEFDLNIPDEDAEKIQTVGDAIKYIEEHQ